jgi:hypothetical protein
MVWKRLALFALAVPMLIAIGKITNIQPPENRQIDVLLKNFKSSLVDTSFACSGEVTGQTVTWNINCKPERPKSIVVWGDSHAGHYFDGISNFLGSLPEKMSASIIWSGGCPPLPGIERIDDDRRCSNANQVILDYLLNASEVKTVIMAARFVRYAKSVPFGIDTSLPMLLVSTSGKKYSSQEEMMITELDDVVMKLHAAGKFVVILNEVPEMPVDAYRCHARNAIDAIYQTKFSCDISFEAYQKRIGTLNVEINEIGDRYSGVCIFNPEQFLCDEKKCSSKRDGKVLYFDNHHLNSEGSRYIGNYFDFQKCIPKEGV